MATERATKMVDLVTAEMVDCTPKPPAIEFLEELRDRARRYGWGGDYIEIRDFVEALYRQAGFEVPDLEPYPVND